MALRLPTIIITVLMSLAALSSWAQDNERQNPFQQAADFYLDNVRRAPNDLELHRELMDTFREKMFTTVPIAIYRNFLERNANNSMILYLLGYAYLMAYDQPMAEGEPDPLKMAEENLKAALQIKSNFPDAVSAMGDLYLRKNQPDLAIEKWEEAIKLDSRFEAAHLSMARFYRSQKEYDKAIENYQRAISLKPKRVAIRYLELGLTYMDMEDLDRAENAFEKAKKSGKSMLPAVLSPFW